MSKRTISAAGRSCTSPHEAGPGSGLTHAHTQRLFLPPLGDHTATTDPLQSCPLQARFGFLTAAPTACNARTSRGGGYLLVLDELTGLEGREVEQRWNVPDDPVTVEDGRARTVSGTTDVLLQWLEGAPQLGVDRGRQDPLSGWRSLRYGAAKPAPTVTATVTGRQDARLLTLVAPLPEGRAAPTVVASEVGHTVRVSVEIDGRVENVALPPNW